jgi:hypothetical protein
MGGAVAVVAVTVFCQQVDAVLAVFLGLLFSLILRFAYVHVVHAM